MLLEILLANYHEKTRGYTIADKYLSGKHKKATTLVNIAVHSRWHRCDDFDTKLGKSHSSLLIFFVQTRF